MPNPHVSLRRLCPADAEPLAAWAHDEAFRRASGSSTPVGDSHLQHWRGVINEPGPELLRLAVSRGPDIVGYVDLHGTTPTSREFGIAIGPSSNWGAGIGREAARLIIEHGFEQLGLNLITAETHETNRRAQRLILATGFTEVGRQGSELYDSETVGLIQYELPRAEWTWRPHVRELRKGPG